LPTAETVLRIFDRSNELRKDRAHARIKILIRKIGIEAFRQQFQSERRVTLSTASGARRWDIENGVEEAPSPAKDVETVKSLPGFERWRQTNAMPQRQKGYAAVTVVCPLGDLTLDQARSLAQIARKFCAGRMRTTITQNMVLRWIEEKHLPAFHQALVRAELDSPGAARLSDITRCPGSDTCQLAVTKSRGLAQALGVQMTNGMSQDADMEGIHVKISGCTNSCGQHHVATVGFYGTYRKVNGKSVPHYQMLIGGSYKEGEARFGKPLLAFPARRVPEAFKHLVSLYKKEKNGKEDFGAFLARIDRAKLKSELQSYAQLPPYEENPELYRDWTESEDFKVEIGQGECAA
jgi:sulfite reductase beta subunit-like hemoprotein